MFPSRKQRLLFVLAVLLAGAGFQVPSAAHAANPAPQVAPSVRAWTGGTGVYTLTATSRILVDPAHTAHGPSDRAATLSGGGHGRARISSPTSPGFR